MKTLLTTLVLLLTPVTQAMQPFPQNEKQLQARLSELTDKPATQASLVYLFHFGTGREIKAPTPLSNTYYEAIRSYYENDWDKVDWTKIEAKHFHMMTSAGAELQDSFMESFPQYEVYPLDWVKLFDRRALFESTKRNVSSSEKAFWLSLIPCLDSSGEVIADTLASHIALNAKQWVYALVDAERKIQKDHKGLGGLCGDSSLKQTPSAPSQLLELLKLQKGSPNEKTMLEETRKSLESAKLEQRDYLGKNFVQAIVELKAYSSKKAKN